MSPFEAFLSQAASIPELLRSELDHFEPRTRTILTTPEIYGLRQIVLIGSGDSYMAAAAAAPAIRAWTGLPVQAMTAMEAARYVDLGVPPRAAGAKCMLVIAVSYSGEAARVVEATRRLRALGALTVAVSANPEGRLALAADRVLNTEIPAGPPGPGLRSYIASLMAILLVGIRFGEVLMTMTMDSANGLRRQIGSIGEASQGLAQALEPKLAAFASDWQSATVFELLGSGPSLASATYGAAKLVEAAGVHAIPQDGEEFHHLNYFVDRPDTVPTLLFAPSDASAASRQVELRATLRELGRPHLVITDTADASDGDIIQLPQTGEFLAPLIQAIPAAVFAACVARDRHAIYYRGHEGPWRGAKGANLVKNSRIMTREEQLSC